MIKVLNITEEGRGGGALYRILDIANQLVKEVDTLIVAPQTAKRFIDSRKSTKVRATYLPLHHLSRSPRRLSIYLLFFFYEIFLLWKLIRKEKADLVYINASWQIKGVIAAWLAGVRSIWHMNDMHQPKVILVLFKLVAPLAHCFVFASRRTQEYYFSIAPSLKNKTHKVIQAPVDIRRFVPQLSKSDNTVPHIISVGYINPNKDLATLIRSLHYLHKNEIRFDGRVYGGVLETQRNYKSQLQGLKDELELEQLQFCGHRDDTPEIYRKADIYLCSSKYESSPISVWEAMASGLPIIATDVADLSSINGKYDCMIIVGTHDDKEMGEALIRLCSNSDLRQQMGLRARRAAEELFRIDKIAQEHLQLYQNLSSCV